MRRIREFIGSGVIFWGFSAAALLDLFNFLSLAVRLRPQTYQVPLHYSSRFGVDLTGPWYALFYLPVAGALLIILNLLLVWYVRGRAPLLGYFIVSATVLFEVLLLITSFLFLGRL